MKRSRGKRRARPKRLRCAFCGSTHKVQRHHVGGKYHIAWFTIPLCEQKHHLPVTKALDLAKVDMRYTPDNRERLKRARQATLVFLWMLEEIEKTF
jgi:transcription elongation factor Elf1